MKTSKQSQNAVGFSRQKTWRMIKHLEAKKLIWGYTAIFNEQKIGLNHFMLLVKRTTKQLEETSADRIISRKIEDFAAKIGCTIESSSYVHVEYDWVTTFTAKGH